jgi:hypothetical protein
MASESSQTGWIGWIDLNDQSQCKWATSYLAAHGYGQVGSTPSLINFENIEREMIYRASLSTDSRVATASFIKTMRAAWNAKKNRDKSGGRKAYSYVMSTVVENQIRELAGKNPINVTLEGIIDREYQLYVNDQKDFQINLRNARDNRERLQQQIDALVSQLEDAKIKIEAERKANNIVIETIKDLYLKLATQKIMLRNSENISAELTDLEKAEAMKIQDEKIEYFNRSLRAEIAAIGRRRASKI